MAIPLVPRAPCRPAEHMEVKTLAAADIESAHLHKGEVPGFLHHRPNRGDDNKNEDPKSGK